MDGIQALIVTTLEDLELLKDMNPFAIFLKMKPSDLRLGIPQALSYPTLEVLDLFSNCIQDSGATMLEPLALNTSLFSLSLKSNYFTGKGIESICEMLSVNTNLCRLNISSNHLGLQGAGAVGQFLVTNSSLGGLDIGCCKVGEAEMELLVPGLLVHERLGELILMSNPIDMGILKLAQWIATAPHLTILNLTRCQLSQLAMECLWASLQTATALTSLTLDNNPGVLYSFDGIVPFLSENASLTHLSLGTCDLHDDSMAHLGTALMTNTTLKSLSIPQNNLTHQPWTGPMGDYIKSSTTLTKLDLCSNVILTGSDEGVALLHQVMMQNETLEELELTVRHANLVQLGDYAIEWLQHNLNLHFVSYPSNYPTAEDYSKQIQQLCNLNKLRNNTLSNMAVDAQAHAKRSLVRYRRI